MLTVVSLCHHGLLSYSHMSLGDNKSIHFIENNWKAFFLFNAVSLVPFQLFQYFSISHFFHVYTYVIYIYVYLLNLWSVSNIFHNNFDSCYLIHSKQIIATYSSFFESFKYFAQCTLRTWIICTEDLTVKCSSPRCQQLLNYYQLQTLYFIKNVIIKISYIIHIFGFDQGSW